MNKAIFSALRYLLLGFFAFLLFAPLNQSFAVGVGSACSYGTQITPVNCDSGLYCNTDADTSPKCETGQNCHGTCTNQCTVRFSDNGSNTNTCDASKGQICYLPNTCQTTSCSGYCIADTIPHVGVYDTCKAAASNTQGNCKSGLVCNIISGHATGTCFPAVYQCNRSDLPNFWSCPGDYTCGGKDPACQLGTVYQRQSPSCGVCAPSDLSKITCKCGHTPQAGQTSFSGTNDFTCTNGFGQSFPLSYCPNSFLACYNDANATMTKNDVANGQTLYGIQCLTPDQKGNIQPPQANSPCNSVTNGICTSVKTAFGDFNTDPGKFIGQAFGLLLSLSGAIAVILIMRAGYQIMTARGNAEGLQKGREQIVAAIVGLMFLIFSFILLQVIGGDLLRIPGFGSNSSGSLIPELGTCDVNNPQCEPGLVCRYSGGQGQCQKP